MLAGPRDGMDTMLEDGDVLVDAGASSIVMVHGEVTQPNAIAYDRRSTVMTTSIAGGTTQRGEQLAHSTAATETARSRTASARNRSRR